MATRIGTLKQSLQPEPVKADRDTEQYKQYALMGLGLSLTDNLIPSKYGIIPAKNLDPKRTC